VQQIIVDVKLNYNNGTPTAMTGCSLPISSSKKKPVSIKGSAEPYFTYAPVLKIY